MFLMSYQELQKPFFIILFIFISLFAYVKLAGPIPFFINSVQTTKTDLFSTTGEGKVSAVPDMAEISFAVSKTASSVPDAQNQTNTTMKRIIDGLKALGIQEKYIKTTNYSVSPEYDYSQGKQIPRGYIVMQNIEVKIKPIELADKAIDTATTNGATNVSNVSFTFAEDTMKKLQGQARDEAIKQAKEKAQSLAQRTGIKLGRIIDVQEISEPHPVRLGANAVETLKATDSAPTETTPGENTVTTSITLSYETY